MQPIVSERVDTSSKFSYHIAYPISMSLSLVERIATRLQKKIQAIDLQVYHTKTLRINGSLKFQQKTIDQTSAITSTSPFADTLVSYVYGYPEVDEPLALSKTNILNFNLETSRFTADDNMPQEYHNVMAKLIPTPESEGQWFKIASIKLGQTCPCCQKLHDTDTDKCIHYYQTRSDVVFKCKRNRRLGGEAVVKVPLTKDQRQAIREAVKNQPVKTDMEFAFQRFIPTQHQAYTTFEVDNSPLFAIRSNMGTGKTEQLIKFLKGYLPGRFVVMLSCRQTLSTSWLSRYQTAGIPIEDYRDVKGSIILKEGVVQIL